MHPLPGIDPARRLRFSAPWAARPGEQSVVFDARSGDFWIVDHAVHEALHAASGAPADGAGQSLASLPAEVIESLASHGIIEASR